MRGRFPYDENGRIILEVIFFLSIKVFYTKSELRIKFGSVRLYLVMVYLVLAKILNNFLFQLTFTCLLVFNSCVIVEFFRAVLVLFSTLLFCLLCVLF